MHAGDDMVLRHIITGADLECDGPNVTKTKNVVFEIVCSETS